MQYKFLKEKASFMSLVIICAMFSIYLINPVLAEGASDTGENLGCCERTISGESCRYTNIEDCDSTLPFKVGEYQRCEESAFCKPGCCISPEGSCSKQVSKATCEAAGDGYLWDPNADCSLPRCEKGCCVLGGVECALTTEKRCSGITSMLEGLELDFRNAIADEPSCLNVCRQQDDGCCVKDDGSCTRTTRGMCGLDDGAGSEGFYKDIFCSNDNLQRACDPDCVPHGGGRHCVEGLEDVYWFDSCGNREEIVTEEIPWSDNPEKNGNCDYARGTLCSEKTDSEHESAYCKSLNCKAGEMSNYEQIGYDGAGRYNGESWCVYNSKPGPGLDTVGSRHWRHICVNGEEIVEPCKDYREEYCTQMDVKNVPPESRQYREAGCVPNKAKSCTTECNTAKEAESDAELRAATRKDKKCCESPGRSCVWQWTNEDETLGTCLPAVPPGLVFWEDENGDVNQEAQAVCNARSTETAALWQEDPTDWLEWKCMGNCEAYSLEYLQTQNLLCNSAGDCGAKHNYLGEWNNEGYFRGWDKWSPSESDKREIEEEDMPEGYEKQTIFSAEGVGNGIYQGEVDYEDIHSPSFTGGIEMTGVEITGWVFTGLTVASYVGFMIAASILTSSFAYGLGVGAGAVGWVPIVGWVVVAVMAVIMAFLLGFALGADSEERAVTTTCEPWKQPSAGYDCAVCDEDPMHPCSEYKCRSIGTMCRFIPENEGTDKGTCYHEDVNDIQRPVIAPWEHEDGNYPLGVWIRREGVRTDIHSDYQIQTLPAAAEYKAGYEITELLPSFSTIEFGIKTNKPAQCKYSTTFDKSLTFATSANWFGDNYYSKQHNMTIYGLLPNKKYEYYVICKGINGHPKDDEVTPPYKITFKTGEGPDLEPPYIAATEPENNGYLKAEGDAAIAIYVDEVSRFSCKMSKQDIDYSLMETNISCVRRSPESMFAGYGMCAVNSSEMGELQEGANTFYFRCRDKPESGTPPNTMDESFAFTITRSKPLRISNILPPAGAVYFTRNVTLQALTADGAFNGKATCSYLETTGGRIMGEFFTTGDAEHMQEFTGLAKAFYNMQIDCFDDVENTATAVTNFSVEADLSAPNVIALYKDASGLHLTLDEKASCQYSSASFNYGSGTEVSSLSETAVFPLGSREYHIRCMDEFGNIMPEIIVKADV